MRFLCSYVLHNARKGKANGWYISKIRKGKKITSEKNDNI